MEKFDHAAIDCGRGRGIGGFCDLVCWSARSTLELITNGDFETGDFSGWSTSQMSTPYCPWTIDGCVFVGAHGGSHWAGNGFDGSPGEYVLSQVVALPAGDANLSWYEVADASYFGVPRTLEVQIRDASGTTLLGTPYSYTLPFSSFGSGWVARTVDLSAFTGQTIELAFVETIPQNFSGPAWFGIDDISLLAVPAAQPNRGGYCQNGRFVDLVAGQPDVDSHYAGATPARWVVGKGITCDPAPAGFVLKGKTEDGITTGAGMYDLYASS